MYLARRETGKRLRIYQVRSPAIDRCVAGTFNPPADSALVRSGLSGPGAWGIGSTWGEARENLYRIEETLHG